MITVIVFDMAAAVCSISIDPITQTVRELRGPKVVNSISLPAKDI